MVPLYHKLKTIHHDKHSNNQCGSNNIRRFLKNWQAHRALSRRVLAAFPEKELFEFSIGGMRPYNGLAGEMTGHIPNVHSSYRDNAFIPKPESKIPDLFLAEE